MVQYQNLTQKPELFRALIGPGPGTMYPLNPPLAGPGFDTVLRHTHGVTFKNIRNTQTTI